MIIVETFARGQPIRAPPTAASCSMITGIDALQRPSALRRLPPIADALPYAAITSLLLRCVIPESGLAPSPTSTSVRCHPPDSPARSPRPVHREPSNPHSGLASPSRTGHAAVSSLEACTTPARVASSRLVTPARQGRHRTTLNSSGSSRPSRTPAFGEATRCDLPRENGTKIQLIFLHETRSNLGENEPNEELDISCQHRDLSTDQPDTVSLRCCFGSRMSEVQSLYPDETCVQDQLRATRDWEWLISY